MAGGEEKGGEGGLGELLTPSYGPLQHLSQGISGELPQDRPSLPHQEDKQEEDDEEEEESQHTEDQFDGVLDEDTVAEGLHKLGRSAPGIEYVYLNLSLSGRELSDINILSRYVHLQKLELSYNKINDLSCISHMPYLLELNASNNELTTYFVFKPPKNLKEVDFSYNQIPKMQDLSAYQSLTKLLLDCAHTSTPDRIINEFSRRKLSKPERETALAIISDKALYCIGNNIEEIRGLEKCHSLTHLSLSHNRLIAISGLENLPIRILNLIRLIQIGKIMSKSSEMNYRSMTISKLAGRSSLKMLSSGRTTSSNQIEKITGLDSLKTLQKLDLSSNKITSLDGLEEHDLLEVINLQDNQIAELRELECIEDLPLLRVLNLLKNPVQEQTDYWHLVIFTLLQLTELDLKKISVEEKVAAVNKCDPPPEVVAAKDHMTHVMYSMLQPQRIFDSTLPSLDAPYPMLVLVGPLACGKRELTHKICRQFNNFFRYGPCHTTRAAYFGEENRLDYYFVSQEAFDKMVNTGKFIATFKYSGYYYGLGRDTVESIAREGLATCVHLEIEGVRSLKNTYFKPRYILLVPMNKEKYEGHLRRKGLFSRPEIEEAVSRVDMYIKISQDFPGYFDAVVNTDELDEAFTELSFLVKSYLGLEPPAVFDSIQDLNSRAGAGSRIRPLQERRLSPGGVITGTTRSSSVNEFLDSSAKNYPGGISDKLAAQLGSVEEASLQRRRSAARQALSRKAPSAYVQLFQRDLAVTPAPSSSRQQLLEATIHASLLSDGRNVTQDQSIPLTNPESRLMARWDTQKPTDATQHDLVKHNTPDPPSTLGNSCRESGPASGLFLISAGAPAGEGLSVRTPVPHARLTEEAKAEHEDPRGTKNGVDRLKVSAETELPNDNLQRKNSKSKTGSSHMPQLINWPGSHSKPVLPPIPSGRKRTNP